MRHPSATASAAQHQSTQAENHSQGLAPEHLDKLRSSALEPQQIEALAWSTGLNGRLQIPYLRPDGSPEQCHNGKPFIRERLTAAEIEADPKGGKYKSPYGNGCRIYHSQLAIAAGNYEQRLADRFTTLRITEGELKTESATVHDAKTVTIGLGGVSSWCDRYDGGEESRPLVDFDEIKLDGREVRLCFDSDLQKPQVLAALKGLAEFLKDKGARVLIEVLPHDLNGDRLGIDDLIYRHGAECFHRIAAIARTPFKTKRQDGVDVLVWAFNPEPLDTRERNAYLSGLVGRHWRRSADAKDRWQQWTGTHWIDVVGDDDLAAAIESFAELQSWRNRELTTFRSLAAAFRRSIKTAAAAFAATGLVPFRNGCLRLADGALVDHQPEHGNTWALPYDYDPEARCHGITAFLRDRLGDEASVAVFRSFARTLLTGQRVKAFLEITGPGNTGKSVLTNLLIALVGSGNHAAGKLHRLEDSTQRFETLKLKGKRLAVFSECDDYSGLLQNLKAITGDDSIAAEVKGGRHIDFTFDGGVVLTGNRPIRASDPSGAVINRRRSLYVGKVVAAGAERKLLEPDGAAGWRGELVAELPGFVNWILAMPAAEARSAIARDVNSIARTQAELSTLLETDYLAEWAEESLIWDEAINAAAAENGNDRRLSVGLADSDANKNLYAHYLGWISVQGPMVKPLSLRVFKAKLVEMLRETLTLPMPPGKVTARPHYRDKTRGSVVPCIRWRLAADDATEQPGVIRSGFQARANASAVTDQEQPVTDWGWIGDGKNSVGDSRDGSDGFSGFRSIDPQSTDGADPWSDQQPPVSPMQRPTAENPSPSVSCVTDRVSGVANPSPSVTGDGSIHPLPPPIAEINQLLERRADHPQQTRPKPPAHRAPATAAEWVEAALAELRLAPHCTHLPEVVAWINRQPTAPLIAQAQLAGALDRLQRDDRDGEQQGLDLEVAA